MRRNLTAAAALVLLTGCSTAQPEPSTSSPTASTSEQFAAVVTEHEEPITTAGHAAGGCVIDMSLDSTNAEAEECIRKAEDALEAVDAIGTEFAGLMPAPGEIESLVSQWLEYGIQFDTKDELDVAKHCEDAGSDACSTAVVSSLMILDEVVVPSLGEWDAYR